MMLFDGYGVCGAGTKRDIFYLHNVYVNNFVIYFHLYDWLKQGEERPPGLDGCFLVFGQVMPVNWKDLFEIHIFVSIRFFPATKRR